MPLTEPLLLDNAISTKYHVLAQIKTNRVSHHRLHYTQYELSNVILI